MFYDSYRIAVGWSDCTVHIADVMVDAVLVSSTAAFQLLNAAVVEGAEYIFTNNVQAY